MKQKLKLNRTAKKHGCIYYAFIIAVFFIVLSITLEDDKDTVSTDNDNNISVSSENTLASSGNAIQASSQDEISETPVTTPEPATEDEWVRHAALDVYEDDLISIEMVDVDKDAPMIELYCVFRDNWTKSLRRDMFMFDARDFMKSIVELSNSGKVQYESVFIHGRTTFLDKYGNESEGDAMSIRVYASELQKVNWDNMRIDMLQDLAVSYAVHPLFRD